MAKHTVILLFLLLTFQNLPADDLKILQATDNAITIEFSPGKWQITEKTFQNKRYISPRFLDDQLITKAGEPMVPGKIVTIGIPLTSSVEFQLVEAITGEKRKGTLIPTPTPLPEYSHQEDPTYYQQLTKYPAQIVEIGSPVFIRDQRVVQIKFWPVQFEPTTRTVQLYNKIVVNILFNNNISATRTLKQSFAGDETFYQSQILNYEQARNWRAQRSMKKKILKSASLSNDWYKIYIDDDGIYKITGQMLSDAGLPTNSIDPKTIRIYNNGGKELPRDLFAARSDSLTENAIWLEDDGDNVFDASDYLLFYGKSVNGWHFDHETNTYTHYINHYTENNIYWLTWNTTDTGKRMPEIDLNANPQTPLISKFEDHVYLEEELFNLIDSGVDWYGKEFSTSEGNITVDRSFVFDLTGAVPADTTELRIRVAATTGGKHHFNFYCNDKYLGAVDFYGSNSKYTVISISDFTNISRNILKEDYNQIKLRYIPDRTISRGYLDWIEIDFWRKYMAREDQLFCYSPANSGTYRYQITDFSNGNVFVFDITDLSDVRIFDNTTFSGNTVEFADTVNSDRQKQYLALTEDKFRSPVKIEKDIASNLRDTQNGAEFVIITHDDFYHQAMPLKSLRENCDNLKTEVVKISDIYDEFSWGLFDPVAIRDFLKYAYDNWSIPPRYALLFGSGDFDYRNIIDPVDRNYIPPFQTLERYEGDSHAWDDWYGLVSGDDNLIDIAIGRLPVRSPEHAEYVVQKIINYKNAPDFGDWRNEITLVADDIIGDTNWGVEREHTDGCELIAKEYIPPTFNVNKIYLIEYPPVYTASITGIRKPAAQQDIIESLNRGCLIINYIGHGRYDLWAHEVVLDMDTDLQKINNGKKQALWIAGTCYFGRFDNPAYESMSEELMNMEGNGAIAVVAAARLVGSNQNITFNKELYNKLFPTAHHKLRLGDALISTKNTRGNYENDQKLILFADPTMHLANPEYQAKIIQASPDSIKALSQMRISGIVEKDGEQWNEFNGTILVKSFDSKKNRVYQIDDENTLKYELPGNTIFRGTGSVENGSFDIKFIVPKDITYGGEDGRFSLYFWDGEVDGSGYKNNVTVGGTESNLHDNTGPHISLKFNNNEFEHGGFTNPSPELTIEIADSLSGINIAGDIGHSINLTIDDEKINVTSFFNYYQDSYLSGHIQKQLGPLNEGLHDLVIKAWDNSNNSTELRTQFTVVADDKLVLERLLNYPNPFANQTEFTFWTNNDCEAAIKIYTVAGRLIKKIDHVYAKYGFNHIEWDGLDADGEPVANGVYLYKIYAKAHLNGSRTTAEAIEKLMIIR